MAPLRVIAPAPPTPLLSSRVTEPDKVLLPVEAVKEPPSKITGLERLTFCRSSALPLFTVMDAKFGIVLLVIANVPAFTVIVPVE